MSKIETLFREDRINTATQQMATRILRSVADQVQSHLTERPSNGKKILIACADVEAEELGAQMFADLLESRGWEVAFIGGGVPSDEIISLLGQFAPHVFLIYGSQPSDVPGIRLLVDNLREIGVQPTMNVVVSGGVFNRAEGLWSEVNADHFAADVREALQMIETLPPRDLELANELALRKRRRRRKSRELEATEV